MKGSEGVAILNISFASPSWEKLMKGSEGVTILNISFASPSWEKQKEILDSINYAKRIQMTLIPSEKQIQQILKRSSG